MRAEKLFGYGILDVLRRRPGLRSGEQVGIRRRMLYLFGDCGILHFRQRLRQQPKMRQQRVRWQNLFGNQQQLQNIVFKRLLVHFRGRQRFRRRVLYLFGDFGILHFRQRLRQQPEMRQQQLCFENLRRTGT